MSFFLRCLVFVGLIESVREGSNSVFVSSFRAEDLPGVELGRFRGEEKRERAASLHVALFG